MQKSSAPDQNPVLSDAGAGCASHFGNDTKVKGILEILNATHGVFTAKTPGTLCDAATTRIELRRNKHASYVQLSIIPRIATNSVGCSLGRNSLPRETTH